MVAKPRFHMFSRVPVILFLAGVSLMVAACITQQKMADMSGLDTIDWGRPSMVVQAGHTGEITALAYSPDGKFLVSGARDNTVKLWRADGTLFAPSLAIPAADETDGHPGGIAHGGSSGSRRQNNLHSPEWKYGGDRFSFR